MQGQNRPLEIADMDVMYADCLRSLSGTQMMESGAIAIVNGRRAIVTGHTRDEIYANTSPSYLRAQFIPDDPNFLPAAGKPNVDIQTQAAITELIWKVRNY